MVQSWITKEIVWEKRWEERAWEMAERGEVDTRDWFFSGGRPLSDVRPGLLSNSTKVLQCCGLDCQILQFKMTLCCFSYFYHCWTTFPLKSLWNFLQLTFLHLPLALLLPSTLLHTAHCTDSYHYYLSSLLLCPLPLSSSPFTWQ